MMNLHLQRIERGDRYTMGRLAIDGEPFCDTLEPTDRHLEAATMRPEQKVFGQTAIRRYLTKPLVAHLSERQRKMKIRPRMFSSSMKLTHIPSSP